MFSSKNDVSFDLLIRVMSLCATLSIHIYTHHVSDKKKMKLSFSWQTFSLKQLSAINLLKLTQK